MQDIGSNVRYSVGWFGAAHIYNGLADEWIASCLPVDIENAQLLIAVGQYATYRDISGNVSNFSSNFKRQIMHIFHALIQPTSLQL